MASVLYQPQFNMIDNYIYLYHTDTLVLLPAYCDSVQDMMNVKFNSSTALTRTAPIYSYENSGPRTMQINFELHRDIMLDINKNNSKSGVELGSGDDTIDVLIREIQAAALPKYQSADKLVNPPLVAIRLGSDIFIKGVVNGTVGVTYKYPIIPGVDSDGKADNSKHRYGIVGISFQVEEFDPYDADLVRQMGSFRGLSTSLERVITSHLTSGTTKSSDTTASVSYTEPYSITEKQGK